MKVAKHAAEHDKPFMMNLSSTFVPHAHGKELLDALPYIDILFGNRSEYEAYAEANNMQTKDMKEIGKSIANYEKVWFINRGKSPKI